MSGQSVARLKRLVSGIENKSHELIINSWGERSIIMYRTIANYKLKDKTLLYDFRRNMVELVISLRKQSHFDTRRLKEKIQLPFH